jgi:hypothetical protein
MRLKEMTPELVEELKEKLRFLEEQEFREVFQSPKFPQLNSTISGSTDNQSTPTWYTHIQDILEQSVVEYDEMDIEDGNFLEMKLVLLPHSLDIYFYLPNTRIPMIEMNLAAEVQDIEKGTFRFNTPIINQIKFSRDTLKPVSIA